jgi:hypothetical protein
MAEEVLCSGCGTVAASHPYVGVARDDETGAMTSYPVCLLCWRDPSHRQRVLKYHFFEAHAAMDAVAAADANILVEKLPE